MLILATIFLIQYGGPPMWPRDPRAYPRPGQEMWEPERRFQTDPNLCIRYGYCLDPRRPQFGLPPFEGRRRNYDLYEDDE